MGNMSEDDRKVTAAELVRSFAFWREQARTAPVKITHHGRETHVLCEVKDYERLERQAIEPPPGQACDGILAALADWIDEALILCDSEVRVVSANRTALALIGKDLLAVAGLPLSSVFPALAECDIVARVRRTGQPATAQIASPFRPGNRLYLQVFPVGERVGIKLRDVTGGDVTPTRGGEPSGVDWLQPRGQG